MPAAAAWLAGAKHWGCVGNSHPSAEVNAIAGEYEFGSLVWRGTAASGKEAPASERREAEGQRGNADAC
jgi:hypothetical protein